MGHLKLALSAAFALSFSAACGDFTGVDLSDLEGTWECWSFVMTNVSTLEETDMIQDEGYQLTMVIRPDGTLTMMWWELSQVDPSQSHGTISVDGDRVTVEAGGPTMTGTIELSGAGHVLNIDTDPVEIMFGDLPLGTYTISMEFLLE